MPAHKYVSMFWRMQYCVLCFIESKTKPNRYKMIWDDITYMRFMIEYLIFRSCEDTAMKKNKHDILVAF